LQAHCGLRPVETGVNAAAKIDALQPGEDEQGSFNPTQLAQCDRKAVLSRVAAQLAKHERSRHGALFDRRGEAEDLVPMRGKPNTDGAREVSIESKSTASGGSV
jgi:hypothetical protein